MNPPRVSDPKINILRVIARLNIGGPAIHVVLLSAGMDRVRFESLLVSGNENPGGGSMLDYVLSHGVQPAIIPEIVGEFSLGPREMRALVRLYLLMWQEHPHVVHTAKAGFVGRLAARLARVPVVVHTFHGHVLHGYYGPRKTQLLRRMERGLACLTDCIITVSEHVKRDLVTYGVAAADRIQVISLGLELDPFLESGPYRGAFRRELQLNGVERLIGIVGRIFPIKNRHLFLEAAALVAREDPAARFAIVCWGATRLIREGETGYLVPPGDAPAVATALLRVLHQPEMARCMGETARKAARERFSAQRLITDMEQLYLELLGRKRVLC
jgi:glycosyltransferase involved in cell wall biosynthesis